MRSSDIQVLTVAIQDRWRLGASSRTANMARILSVAALISSSSALSCLDDTSGQPVDWYSVFKFHGGLDYAYVDVATADDTINLQLTGKDLNTSASAVGSTLLQLYGNVATTLAIVAYNDEKPEALQSALLRGSTASLQQRAGWRSGTSGHTKGVLAADEKGGFWLVHSVPKFPDLALSNYSWTASTTYGQSFLCISLDKDGVEAAGAQIQYNDPSIYFSNMPSGIASTYPTVAALIDGTRSEGSSVATLSSVPNGHAFVSLAKSGSWGQDLYEDLVQPHFNGNFWWETWRRSPVMPTYCKSDGYAYDSINVETLSFLDSDGTPVGFKYTQDHSKYGVLINASSTQDHWTCIGDINRMSSQWTRGGGTVCVRATQLYHRVLASVATADPCPT